MRRSEPADLLDPAGLARGPEGLDRLDAERVVEGLDLAEAEAGDASELARAGGQPVADLLEGLRAAGVGEVADHRGQALPDSGQGGQAALGDKAREVGVAEPLEHARPSLVGSRAERLASGEGEQIRGLAERARDGEAIHPRPLEQATCRRATTRLALHALACPRGFGMVDAHSGITRTNLREG
jgi:hypothetical protein